ncbi:ribosome biogenesis protein ytm1 [Vermiconidia calcicola]|uniref:Ribosome biogenesis protein ytm1 n=1 Tax=Vermiconidia calcicola TaxID=1690605 RepID=A0ACC3NJU0_9PEZI|nr:ribosome biogenesis protein ytm1 [Vermiconidia calcicola]
MADPSDLPQSILSYISHNEYPDTDALSSTTLTSPSTLQNLLQSLQSAQKEAQDEIRTLSRSAAPDIDAWIARAKDLQADILRSRETAREIVREADQVRALRDEAEDQGKKFELLEKEVRFNETLTGTLEHVQYANGLLATVQEEAVNGDVGKALANLEDAEASIAGLDGMRGTRAVEVLGQRGEELRKGLVETTTMQWDALIAVDVEMKCVKVRQKMSGGAAVDGLGLDAVVAAAKGLEIFDSLLQKLARDIDRAVLKPCLHVDQENQAVDTVTTSSHAEEASLSCKDVGSASVFQDLHTILTFFSEHLSTTITVPLSYHLIPVLSSRLEAQRLDPSIPVSMDELSDFQSLLTSVSDLAEEIESLGWNGAKALRGWVDNAPRAWLTKRREVVLGDVRDLVFRGLRERKVVERVETRKVHKEDGEVIIGRAGGGGGGGGEGEDDWDTAWEEEPEKPVRSEQPLTKEDEDDASAWELDEEDDDNASSGKKEDAGGGDEDDAWGWGDDDTASQNPASPVANRKQHTQSSSPSKPNGSSQPPTQPQELTLRETITTTEIPDSLLSLLQRTIFDAETLSSEPQYVSSPIAPAATALYTLPTLALAMYRAAAPTAYAKDHSGLGNLLVYNDASRIAELLREWQSSQPEGSRLRIDSDVAALETFAKRAYSSEMEAQRTILRDLLDGAQGFVNCTIHPYKGECEGAVDATVDRIKHVHALWKGILSEGALLQSLGSLVGTVTTKMATEIQDLGDISEADSHQLKALCDRVLALNALFRQGEGEGQDMTFIYSPPWLKFQYLAEILDSSLADIRWMWKEGELSLEFGKEEVVELVEALFAESELRRQAVREVRWG